MSRDDKRQVWTLAIGGGAALLAAFLGLINSDLPTGLHGLISSATAWSIVWTCTIPIIIVLAANQVSSLFKASSDREATVRDITRILPQACLISHFDDSHSAMNYLIQNVPRAEQFYNTRFAPRHVEESEPGNIEITKLFDDVVKNAIRAGVDYHWIISQDYEQLAMSLKAEWKQRFGSKQKSGVFAAWVLPPGASQQLFHFAILDYGDSKDLLLGWSLSSVRQFAEKVFLIRDERMVEYFRGVFELYVAASREI